MTGYAATWSDLIAEPLPQNLRAAVVALSNEPVTPSVGYLATRYLSDTAQLLLCRSGLVAWLAHNRRRSDLRMIRRAIRKQGHAFLIDTRDTWNG